MYVDRRLGDLGDASGGGLDDGFGTTGAGDPEEELDFGYMPPGTGLNSGDNITDGTAFDGEFGIDKVKETKPDVVLLDFVMPGKDGLETAKGIRKIMPNVKIIMVTQNALDEGVKSQIGALDHILKPITVNKLESAFAKI